jgi:hypothetical protein
MTDWERVFGTDIIINSLRARGLPEPAQMTRLS